MGARGPAPLPANVHMMRGNPSKLAAADLRAELRPPTEIPGCPDELQAAAKAEWERIAEQLAALGLVAQIDRAALSFYCAEWGRWMWAEQKMAEENAADPKHERGYIVSAPSGYKVHSVYLQISRAAQDKCMAYAKEFGMTPSARSRVTPGESGQLGLPGVDAPTTPAPAGLGAFASR